MNSEKSIYSIGHSTLPIDHFLDLLKIYKIKAIADVRRFPTSKKYPHFEQQNLKDELAKKHIDYHWLGEFLGGYRKGGYQLYMQSELFSMGIRELVKLAEKQTTAFMCAEKLFFRCHRRFIADQVILMSWNVIHIIDQKRTYLHKSADPIPLAF
ncbi:MAG: DUF488 domain-containing protein [bacterium]|nr:MAG: DUF488 domain-containing protein [bacterium]